MLRSVINLCDIAVRPIGNLMLCPQAKALAHLPSLPVADTAIAMAFAQRRDGLVNLPTQSIVERTVQLYREKLACRLIFFGSKQENNITEAQAMASKAIELGVNKEIISKVEKPSASLVAQNFSADLAVKELDMALLGQELERLGTKSSYLVAHPIHLGRVFMLCRKQIPNVTFYPVEAERLYDWESNQLRCRAEIFFLPWNILAFAEHLIKGKI